MNRRSGVIAMLAAAAGLLSGRAKASGAVKSDDGMLMPKGRLSFDLDSFTGFEFRQGDDTVTLTPEEIMAALKEKPPHAKRG